MLPTKFEVWTTYVTFSLHMTHITNFPHIILNYNNNHNYIVYTLVSLITVLTCKFQSQYCFWSVLFLVRGRGLLELVCCAALWVVAGEDTHIQHSPQMSGAWKEGGGVVVSIQWLVPIKCRYGFPSSITYISAEARRGGHGVNRGRGVWPKCQLTI